MLKLAPNKYRILAFSTLVVILAILFRCCRARYYL